MSPAPLIIQYLYLPNWLKKQRCDISNVNYIRYKCALNLEEGGAG